MMPDDFVIKPFLVVHRAEVKGMLLTEYNEAEAMERFKEDGRKEGRIEGRIEGRKEGIIEGRKEGAMMMLIALVNDGLLSVKDASVRAGVSEDAFRRMMEQKNLRK